MNEEIKSESKHNGKELLNKFPSCLDKEKDDEIGEDILGETNEFFEKIKEAHKFIKLLEQLELTEYINIPRICSIGNQSNGKTSILTNIIGLDILPKGEGIITRRPLELRLNHYKGKPYINFDEDKNNKITDFQYVKEKINKLTNSICGNNKDIKNDPLIINVYSKTCPNLTIIDLPGITRVPVGDQPKNIEEITKDMTLKYINDPYTIILCAIDVNQDLSTSDGLYLAKEVDYYGERTLGVLTKVDLMDEGTDCVNILLNKIIPLKLGYIALKNRSKLDLMNNVSVKEGLEKEKLFFDNNEIYNKMDKKLFGIKSLIDRLIELYTNLFYKNIGDIIYSINQHIIRLNKELLSMGKPVSSNIFEKNILMQNCLKNFCDTFFDVLNNKRSNLLIGENNNDLITNNERMKITNLYDNFLIELYLEKNNNIKLPNKLQKNISFLELLTPNLKIIEKESIFLFETIVEFLFKLSHKSIHIIFKRFDSMENKISEIIENIFEKQVKNTKVILEQILKYELTYEFTNDKNFLEKYEKQEIIINDKVNKTLLQIALNDYYLIIIRNIRNIIPKTIQYKLIINLENNLYKDLVDHLIKNQEILNDLKETEKYINLRKYLNNKKKELETLLKKIYYSPTISKSLLTHDKNQRKTQLLIIQKEKRDKLFKSSLKKLKDIRNDINNNYIIKDIKDSLESMCIIGNVIYENILEEKEKNPEKFIPINEAIKCKKKDPLFCLGLLAQNLEEQGIMTVIEKEEVKTEEEKDLSISILDFIANGMINKTKFDLHFDFGEERNEQLLFNEYEQKKFKDLIVEKISKKFIISKENLILTNSQRGSFKISLFQMEDFNKLSLKQLKFLFKMDPTLCKIKQIQEDLIFKACKLTKNMLDAKGNRRKKRRIFISSSLRMDRIWIKCYWKL